MPQLRHPISITLTAALACSSPQTSESQGTSASTGSTEATGSVNPTTSSTSATTLGSGEATGSATGTNTGATHTTTGSSETAGSTGDATTGDPASGTGAVSESDGNTSGGSTDGSTGSGSTGSGGGSTGGGSTGGEEPNPVLDEPNLWYSVDKALVYIQIDPATGVVLKLVHNQLSADVPLWHGQNGLTMLTEGGLLGSRESAQGTQIYYVADPPITDNSPASATFLGTIAPDKGQPPPRIEALYTDCEGRVYLMDTGKDVSSAEGNRLLRFTGDYIKGDLGYEVITDLQKASVADIDDLSPGIVQGQINDKLGFAIDSTILWQIDYTTGTGMNLAKTSGTWGVHALGGPFFADKQPRLYVLSQTAALYQVDLVNYVSSPMLIMGPDLKLLTGHNGWSGLAGPLTDCVTLLPQ